MKEDIVMSNLLIKEYERELECTYKGETYLVRDNGAVLRCSRPNQRKRPLDNKWVFGTASKSGYMEIAGERAHRIVAFAFLGKPSDIGYVVDHIDTNRQNNKPSNLRWVSKLENILLNPYTSRKIELLCDCSIKEVLKDITILQKLKLPQGYTWLSSVSQKEADDSLNNFINFGKKKDLTGLQQLQNSNSSEKFNDYVYAFTLWMKKRLRGRDISLLGFVTSKGGKSNFKCSNGHTWRTWSQKVGEGDGCPQCNVGQRSAEQIWQDANLGYVYMLIHQEKLGLIKIFVTSKNQDELNDFDIGFGWKIRRFRSAEDQVLAKKVIAVLLGIPLSAIGTEIECKLEIADDAMRKFIYSMHTEAAKQYHREQPS
jgi:hypothetical protein